jgi:DNA replication protein DnaC
LLRYQLKIERFAIHRDLTGFDLGVRPLTTNHIHELVKECYLDTVHNFIFVSGTSTGKIHIAIALCVAAIHLGERVYFYGTVDWVNLLEEKEAQGWAGNLAK